MRFSFRIDGPLELLEDLREALEFQCRRAGSDLTLSQCAGADFYIRLSHREPIDWQIEVLALVRKISVDDSPLFGAGEFHFDLTPLQTSKTSVRPVEK